ncbi:MAG: alpha/beta hydrolase [Chloroflexi bacterium]|nr:alpha/beta hydrolase [Chloroflexota bacterium]
MAVPTLKRYVRPYDKAKENLLERARESRNPFEACEYEVVDATLDRLTTLDRETWAATWSAVARPYEERAREAEARGDTETAMRNFRLAYGYFRVGRYTTTNSPGKRDAYRRSSEMFLKWGAHLVPPVERVEIPFPARPGEGSTIPAYLRAPASPRPAPVLVQWGGIDGFKEDRRDDNVLEVGLASLSMDMPGVGDSPIRGSADAERLFSAVFDWIANRPELDGSRVAIWGRSTGGYWAAKVAHIFPDRIRGAVDHGGCTHFAFTPDWIERSQDGEYAFELAETLAYAFGMSTFEDWVENAPRFSLLRQDVLDRPCAPLLLINGIHDTIFPIQDMYLLLEHGAPKTARLYNTGHMGHTPRTDSDILDFVTRVLR